MLTNRIFVCESICKIIWLVNIQSQRCADIWVTDHLGYRCLGDVGRTFSQHNLDIWVTCHLRIQGWLMCRKAWWQRIGIFCGWHFALDSNLVQYSSDF